MIITDEPQTAHRSVTWFARWQIHVRLLQTAVVLCTTAALHQAAAATVAPVAKARAILALTPQHLGLYTAGLADHCGHTAASLSPSGRYLLSSQPTWRKTTAARNTSTLTITDLDCLQPGSAGTACSVTLQAIDGLRPIAWSTNERVLFLIEQDRALVSIELPTNLGDTRVSGRVELPPTLATTLASLDVSPSRSIGEEVDRMKAAYASVRRAMRPGETILGLHVRAGQEPSALVEQASAAESALTVALIAGAKRYVVAPRGPELMSSTISFEANDGRTVTGVGYRVDLGSSLGPKPGPYERPLISPGDGRWMGGLSNWSSTLPKDAPGLSRSFGTETLAYDWRPDGGVLNLSRTAGRIDLRGVRRGRRWTASCDIANGTKPIIEDRPLAIGSAQRPLSTIRSAAKSNDAFRRAIYFPGGPGGGVVDPAEDYIVRRLVALGYVVETVNYSGSLGSGLDVSGRLRSEGTSNAISRDVEAVIQQLIANRKQETLIVGVSLGALPALELDRRLFDHPHRIALIEPLLAYREPRVRVRSPSFAPYQRTFEAAMLGLVDDRATKGFAAYLERLQSNRSTSPMFAAFGKDDLLSSRDDWHKPVGAGDYFMIVPGDHAFAPFNPDVWSALNAWLQQNTPKVSRAGLPGIPLLQGSQRPEPK